MKLTETWTNRDKFINLCKEHSACEEEFKKLIKAKTEIEWLNVICANFYWCVKKEILEEWLPVELPNVTELDCRECTGLTSLPELPNVTKLDCSWCTGLKERE